MSFTYPFFLYLNKNKNNDKSKKYLITDQKLLLKNSELFKKILQEF